MVKEETKKRKIEACPTTEAKKVKKARVYNKQIVDDTETLKTALCEIEIYTEKEHLIALDCEGDNLSRKGKLTVVTIATRHKVYIIRIDKLKEAAFEGKLKTLLENKSVEKLMFDCRQDADILMHSFKVNLSGVLDMQLLEVMFRRDNPVETTTKSKSQKSVGNFQRRCDMTDDVENIYGFDKCLELYVKNKSMIKIKQRGRYKMLLEGRAFKPENPLFIRYCCADTLGLFKLYDKLNVSEEYMTRLKLH